MNFSLNRSFVLTFFNTVCGSLSCKQSYKEAYEA